MGEPRVETSTGTDSTSLCDLNEVATGGGGYCTAGVTSCRILSPVIVSGKVRGFKCSCGPGNSVTYAVCFAS